jgi:hypothetical protein
MPGKVARKTFIRVLINVVTETLARKTTHYNRRPAERDMA